MGNAALGCAWSRPVLHHAVRVLLGEFLNRGSSAAIGVAFTQNWVNGRAKALGETDLQFFFCGSRRLFRVAGDIVALFLKLSESFLQLWDRSADVRKLDNVCFRLYDQLTKFGQVISYLLIFSQVLGEICDNATRQ